MFQLKDFKTWQIYIFYIINNSFVLSIANMLGGDYLFDNGDKKTANKGPHIRCENHLEFALYVMYFSTHRKTDVLQASGNVEKEMGLILASKSYTDSRVHLARD